jgi:preprotein translocase subunit Sec61beta
LIDPLIMGHFIELYEEYEGKGMKAAFYDNQLLIMVESNKNFFEPANIEIPATDPRSILTMKNEIQQILSIIDRLNLYDPLIAHEQSVKTDSDGSAA